MKISAFYAFFLISKQVQQQENCPYIGVSGGQEDGKGWRQINVLVSKGDQHTTSCAAQLSV